MSSIKTVIGLTGLYCSGKSTIEKILESDYNFFVIDVDKIGHLVLEDKKDIIIEYFGAEILSNGIVNRKILGQLVFSDKKKLAILNSIVHPQMKKKIEELIKISDKNKICISAALLFEMNLDNLCNKIIVVKSPIIEIIKRAKKRDNRSIVNVLRILNSQKVCKYSKQKNKKSEILYIKNDKNLDRLRSKIDNVIKQGVGNE